MPVSKKKPEEFKQGIFSRGVVFVRSTAKSFKDFERQRSLEMQERSKFKVKALRAETSLIKAKTEKFKAEEKFKKIGSTGNSFDPSDSPINKRLRKLL